MLTWLPASNAAWTSGTPSWPRSSGMVLGIRADLDVKQFLQRYYVYNEFRYYIYIYMIGYDTIWYIYIYICNIYNIQDMHWSYSISQELRSLQLISCWCNDRHWPHMVSSWSSLIFAGCLFPKIGGFSWYVEVSADWNWEQNLAIIKIVDSCR